MDYLMDEELFSKTSFIFSADEPHQTSQQQRSVCRTPSVSSFSESRIESCPSIVQFYLDQDLSESNIPLQEFCQQSFAAQVDVTTYVQKQYRQTAALIKIAQAKQNLLSSSTRPVRQGEFRWSNELHEKFVVVCLAFGLRKVTPKQIQTVLDIEASRESVGSHLQKFRIKLIKQHGLPNSQHLDSHHFPLDIQSAKIDELRKLWSNPLFSGMTQQEVIQFIK
ncbi:Conserved_hypothetical protein [Hexamita inflata]|uniref:Uncharacterized protein n=1 Tax=Hexamita inflata TaxID=28002 RepID=A0AA86NLV1_9EUKA|nr:Conserved hypothetical protein [Hexamita inflata]